MYITDVYSDATVLVTGGTGFVGKGLIEKLLRTCTNVRKVILLIRTRKNMTGDQRLEILKQDMVFDKIRESNPDALNKLSVMYGDISCDPKMGLSASDEKLLVDEVSFVFHSAATVSFGLGFEATSNINILGTKRLLDVCLNMKKFKSFIYVSTAYTGPHNTIVEEKLHPSKKPIDMDKLIHVLYTGTISDKLRGARQYQDDHPNMYTFSKFFAEYLVDHYRRKFGVPVCIVRPSIIGSAYKDPFPGWSTNFNGSIGLLGEVARGAVGSVLSKNYMKLDVIPIDLVCNILVLSAWWTIVNPSPELRIYNQAIDQFQQTLSTVGYGYVINAGRKYPSKYTMMYPNCWITESRILHEYRKWFYQMIPAAIYDLILYFRGEPRLALNVAKAFNKQMELSHFFKFTEFTFRSGNVLALHEACQEAVDSTEFKIDSRNIPSQEYLQNLWLGYRQFILKEDMSNPKETLDRLQIINWIYTGLQILIVVYIGWLLFGWCF